MQYHDMKIEILRTGCPKCKKLTEAAETVVRELGMDCEVAKVTSLADIAAYGVMSTPALALDGTVKIVGRVASAQQIKGLLQPDPPSLPEEPPTATR